MRKKIALVSGGTGGIGTAICRTLLDMNMTVIAVYFNGGQSEKAQRWQEKQQEAGYLFHIQYADVSDWETCRHCFLTIEETIGPVDVLVNNAGITQDSVFKKMAPEQWLKVIQTNLAGAFNMTRLAIEHMINAGWGRVVNISSVNGQKGQFGQTNYSAAKAGIHGFTKALAQEVAAKGVTVNTISPGYIETDMILKLPGHIREQILAEIPVRRFGSPEEIARVVGFLADEASGFITGANIAINGGHHMY